MGIRHARHPGGTGHSRRRLLGLGGALAVGATAGGCGLVTDREPAPPPPPDPLLPLLQEAAALAAAHERAAVARPGLAHRLAPIAADHRAHAAELAPVLDPPPPAGPTGSAEPDGSAPPPDADDRATLAALRTAEQEAHRAATILARAAPPERAALVGSIAAARAAHAEALR